MHTAYSALLLWLHVCLCCHPCVLKPTLSLLCQISCNPCNKQILDRKGFVRIAVSTGTPVVPVYHFGNSKLFRCAARCL